MDKIEVATIRTSSSDHRCVIPQSKEKFEEGFFYSQEGRPSECFSFCRFQVNIGIREDSKEWMAQEKMSESDYIHKYGKDYSTFALIVNCCVPYLRELPEYRGFAYPSDHSPYVSSENDYSLMSIEDRDCRYPKVAWGMAAVFVWDLLYDNDKEDFRLMCEDERLMSSYYEIHLKDYLSAHNTRKYKKLTDTEKEQVFLGEYIKTERNLWERSKVQLAQYNTIFTYTEEYMTDYFNFLDNKLKYMTGEQQNIDEILRNPGYIKENEVASSQPTTSDFYHCHVYVSYPWSDSTLIDDICQCLKMRKIDYFRDTDICGFRENIQKFEEQIGNGKIVIALINMQSMESIDCMYEVCTLVRNGHIEQRLFPVVDLPDLKRNSQTCEAYLKKWKEKEKEILKRYSTNSGDKVNEIRELSYINCITSEFPKFWDYISKHNTSSLRSLRKDNWKILLDNVERTYKREIDYNHLL